ncbi:MAG: amino acid ABC transporter substrate-binding protein [Xanthobacteraceae bacterium]|nr:amino acid ABC transporter substrate-binding protein [Xanthobacteraceae bacterium]
MLKRAIAVAGVIAISAATSPSAFAQSAGSSLEKIVASKTFAIAYREESVPFSFIDSSGTPKGYAIDICLKIAEAIKAEYKLDKIDIKYVPITPQTRIPVIANGTANAECSSTTITTGRMKQVEFLTPDFITGTKLLVRKGSGITKIEDLDGGKTLLALAGTTNEKAALAEIEKRKLKVNVVKVKDHPQALLNLEQGRADAYTSNDVVLYGIRTMAKNPDDYEVVGPFYSYDPFSIMIPKNDTELRAIGLRVMSNLYTSGEIFEMYKKWFDPGPTNINLPMNDDLKNALRLNAFAD